MYDVKRKFSDFSMNKMNNSHKIQTKNIDTLIDYLLSHSICHMGLELKGIKSVGSKLSYMIKNLFQIFAICHLEDVQI